MNIDKLNTILVRTTVNYYDNISKLNMTEQEEQYLYSKINPAYMLEFKHGSWLYNNEKTPSIKILTDKLMKYDNVYLKYNYNSILNFLTNGINNPYFDILFDRLIGLILEQNTFATPMICIKMPKNMQYFYCKYKTNDNFKTFLNKHYETTIELLFALIDNDEDIKCFNNIFNDIIKVSNIGHRIISYNHKIISYKCKDGLASMFGKVCVSYELFDIDFSYIANEELIYKDCVKNLYGFIDYLNFYKKYWDSQYILKQIANKIKYVKIHQYNDKSYIYEQILKNCQFDEVTTNKLRQKYEKSKNI